MCTFKDLYINRLFGEVKTVHSTLLLKSGYNYLYMTQMMMIDDDWFFTASFVHKIG